MCGGESSRMGRDKALLQSGTRTWAELALDKLSALDIPVVASINARQEAALSKILEQIPLIIDNPAIPAGGPLLGLLSAHTVNPTEDLFILACDLPLMEPALLSLLYQRYRKADLAQGLSITTRAWLYTSGGEPEPMCAIYTAAALAKVLDLLQKKELARHSLKFVLQQMTVDLQPVPADKARSFTNFNSPAELQQLLP
jgi:molybdopterin-guanine dinucleotide biosynthesis protein A